MNATEQRFYASLYIAARKGARHRNISWEINRKQFDRIVARAGGACEVTGIPFSFDHVKGCSRRPWVPSLDRKNSRKSYTVSNVRLVCVAANLAMNEWGVSVLRRLAEAMNGRDTTMDILPELVTVKDVSLRAQVGPRAAERAVDAEFGTMVEGCDYFVAPCRCLLLSEPAAARLVERLRTEES